MEVMTRKGLYGGRQGPLIRLGQQASLPVHLLLKTFERGSLCESKPLFWEARHCFTRKTQSPT